MEKEKFNIIFIVLDSVRYDFWLEYFLPIIKLNRIIVFHNTFSTATWTAPAHASMFTGRYPHQHGILAKGETIPPLKSLGLAYELRKKGYMTLAFTCNPIVPYFIGQGFIHTVEISTSIKKVSRSNIPIKILRGNYDPNNRFARLIRKAIRGMWYFLMDPIGQGKAYSCSSSVNNLIKVFLEKNLIKPPYFIFINYMDVHEYSKNINIISRFVKVSSTTISKNSDILRDLYRKSLIKLAYNIKNLIENLNTLGYLDKTIIIITSDHGELLGEYGLTGHGYAYPYNELIHVPLAIFDPREYRMNIYKIISIKWLYDIILAISKGQIIEDIIKNIENFAIIEDRMLGKYPKHYRAVIVPPYKLVYDVLKKDLKILKIKLKGYSEKNNTESLRLGLKTLNKVHKEALLYNRLKNIKRTLLKRIKDNINLNY